MEPFTMTIGGDAVSSARRQPVVNPATGAAFADVPTCSREQLDDAVAAASARFPSWSKDIAQRREALAAVAAVLKENVDELATIITAEQGKPLANARIEVLGCARWFRYYARLELPDQVIQDDERALVRVERRPLGPTAAISVWNFPLTSACWKIGPGLLAGTTFVVKPSPYTPAATLRFGELLRGVLPAGVLNVVSGDDDLGAWLTTHPGIRKISFTGSTATGKLVALAAAADLKRTSLELGGNDAAIVLADADPATVAEKVFWGAFDNTGQICTAIKRLYVHESRYDELVDALAARADKVVVGNGMDEGTQLGPLTNQMQRNTVAGLVDDARQRGARVVTGGTPLPGPGYFYAPTIVTDVEPGFALVTDEQFGPALPVIAYRDTAAAVEQANATPYGLGSSVWGTDLDDARAVAAQLDSGMVWINAHVAVGPHQPFGGVKMSGIGVENSPWAVDSYTELRMVHESRV